MHYRRNKTRDTNSQRISQNNVRMKQLKAGELSYSEYQDVPQTSQKDAQRFLTREMSKNNDLEHVKTPASRDRRSSLKVHNSQKQRNESSDVKQSVSVSQGSVSPTVTSKREDVLISKVNLQVLLKLELCLGGIHQCLLNRKGSALAFVQELADLLSDPDNDYVNFLVGKDNKVMEHFTKLLLVSTCLL